MQRIPETSLFAREATGLVREFGAWTAVLLTMCFMIGVGINFHSVQDLTKLGYSASLTWGMLILGVFTTISAVGFGMLSAMFPRSGSSYVATSRLIHPVLGFVQGFAGHFCSTTLSIGLIGYWAVWFIGFSLQAAGSAVANPGLVSVGTFLAAPAQRLWIGFLLVVLAWLSTSFGPRVYKVVQNTLFAVAALGFALVLLGLLFGPDPRTAWSASPLGAPGSPVHFASYEEIVQAAPKDVVTPPGIDWAATLRFMIIGLFIYGGYKGAMEVAGEVRNPRRNMLLAVGLGTLLVTVVYVVMTGVLYARMGEFVRAYVYVWHEKIALNGKTAPVEPMLPLFGAIMLSRHPILAVIAVVASSLWLLNTLLPQFITCSRMVFAWAMDRAIPERFAEVSSRFHTPIYADLVIFVVAVIGLLATHYNWWFATVAVAGLNLIDLIPTSLACIVAPYAAPELYLTSGNWRLGRVPAVTVLGFISLAFYVALSPFVYGELRDGGTFAVLGNTMYLVVPVLLWVAMYHYNLGRGINMLKTYQEIPPE